MRPVTMRLVPYDPDDETYAVVDWKTGPADVLEEVSELLAPHGLCIVLADSQDDSYRFKVVKADEPKPQTSSLADEIEDLREDLHSCAPPDVKAKASARLREIAKGMEP